MIRYLLVFALLFSCSASKAEEYVRMTGKMCALTRSLSFDKLVNSAGIIFKGQLISNETMDHKQSGMQARKIVFNVIDPIKGISGETFTAYEWASLDSPIAQVKPGEAYIFFFNTPSSLTGLTSLTGLEQGCVHLPESGVPQISARVLGESEKLFGPLHTANLKGLYAQGATSTENSPQNYDEFKKLCNVIMGQTK